MIILIGNQKGGAGKSTLTLLLANFLAVAQNLHVTVIDMDYQQSVSQKFEKAKILENQEPYDVVLLPLEDYPLMEGALAAKTNEYVLVDLPGRLDDDGLIPVFRTADLVVCPFGYDEFSFESTVLFSVVMKKINLKVPVIYVPNRVKANVRYEILTEVNEQLQKFGMVTAPLPDRIDFQRVNTFMTPLSLLPLITPVFKMIYEQIKK